MPTGELLPLIGFFLCAVGLILTWMKNGKGEAKRAGAIEESINGINKRLDDPNSGLGAIKNSVDRQTQHCAGITSSFEERLKDLEEK